MSTKIAHDSSGTAGVQPEKKDRRLGLGALTALVVGSMIGGGAFNLAADLAQGANAGAILIGWVITGIGIIALGLSFQKFDDASSGSRWWGVQLRPGRLRSVCRVQLGVGLLALRVARQRRLCDASVQFGRLFLPNL